MIPHASGRCAQALAPFKYRPKSIAGKVTSGRWEGVRSHLFGNYMLPRFAITLPLTADCVAFAIDAARRRVPSSR